MVIPKFCTPMVAAISELFAQGLYSVTSIATASRLSPSKLCRMVTTMLTTYKLCCVVVRLLPASMAALSLYPWDAMPPPAYLPQPPAPSSSPTMTDTLLIDDGAVSSAPYPNQDLLGHVFPNNGACGHDARPPNKIVPDPPTNIVDGYATPAAPWLAPLPAPLLIVVCSAPHAPGIDTDYAVPVLNRVPAFFGDPPYPTIPHEPTVGTASAPRAHPTCNTTTQRDATHNSSLVAGTHRPT
jgi:hypothetical protein